MQAVKTQKRGICQCCGNQQAVTKGVIAHHGYTTRWGDFNGSCLGSRHRPLNESSEQLEEQNKILLERIESFKKIISGEIVPEKLRRNPWSNEIIVLSEVSDSTREMLLRKNSERLQSEIKSITTFIKDMKKLSEETLGTPLLEIVKEEKAQPREIKIGESVKSGIGILTATGFNVIKKTVVWKAESGKIGQTTKISWRKMELVG